MSFSWRGVFPAVTTPFTESGSVDLAFMAKHVRWQLESGCHGIVALGSLGEGGTLTFAEKLEVLEACVEASGDRPVIAGVAALSTNEAVEVARAAERIGCKGLMVLPPYVYPGDQREIGHHMASVFKATELPCMLYNNPIAYGIDFTPEWTVELARFHPNMTAIKESSADVRRIHELRRIMDRRIEILVGVDDLFLEGAQAGATGWVAGLVNAFPVETMKLYDLAMAGRYQDAEEIYHWFLPLLRLDVVPKFVQLIKLAQQEVGMGSARVRPPRLPLTGQELKDAQQTIKAGVLTRPRI